jgi:hypothetical protein
MVHPDNGTDVLDHEFRRRWGRPVAFGLAMLAIIGAVVVATVVFGAFERQGALAIDYRMFVEFGHRWADHGSIYAPYQLAGRFAFDAGALEHDPAAMPALYPPIAAPIFWLLTIVPGFVWWVLPITGLAIAVRGAQAWTWPLLPLVGWFPAVPALFIVGGSSMWVAAGLALAARWGWPAAVVVFKPSLAPLLVVGIRRKSTWLTLGVLAVISALMLPEWFRYVTVLRNVDSPGLVYSVNDLPLIAAAVITAWSAGRPRAMEARDRLLDSA